jgi:hypothetical protein
LNNYMVRRAGAPVNAGDRSGSAVDRLDRP